MGTWSSPHALQEEGGRGSDPAVQERNRTVAGATTHSTERPPNFKERICVCAGEDLKVTKTKTLEERDVTKARAACDQAGSSYEETTSLWSPRPARPRAHALSRKTAAVSTAREGGSGCCSSYSPAACRCLRPCRRHPHNPLLSSDKDGKE